MLMSRSVLRQGRDVLVRLAVTDAGGVSADGDCDVIMTNDAALDSRHVSLSCTEFVTAVARSLITLVRECVAHVLW